MYEERRCSVHQATFTVHQAGSLTPCQRSTVHQATFTAFIRRTVYPSSSIYCVMQTTQRLCQFTYVAFWHTSEWHQTRTVWAVQNKLPFNAARVKQFVCTGEQARHIIFAGVVHSSCLIQRVSPARHLSTQ